MAGELFVLSFETLKAWCERQGYQFSENPQLKQLAIHYQLLGQPAPLMVLPQLDRGMVMWVMKQPFTVPEDRRIEVARATALLNAAQQEYANQGQPGGAPQFWIVRVPGGGRFNVMTSDPKDLNDFGTKPIAFANVWQGKIDLASETHDGVKFGPVDQNVADSNNPSGV